MDAEVTIEGIYEEVKKLGVEVSHWQSDLYIPITPETRLLIARYKSRGNVTTFTEFELPVHKACVSCGRVSTKRIPIRAWYEIPFAYQPFWDDVERATQKRKENGHWK
jgi:hypothetical protein